MALTNGVTDGLNVIKSEMIQRVHITECYKNKKWFRNDECGRQMFFPNKRKSIFTALKNQVRNITRFYKKREGYLNKNRFSTSFDVFFSKIYILI